MNFLSRISPALLGASLWAVAAPVLAADGTGGGGIDWFSVGMGLLGGLALFLFGIELMSKGLQAAAGEGMKYILAKLTKNRVLGALTGALVTAVLNSSSVTTVLLVGFISAGLMTLAQSVSVILGANVGSTFTAQIIAFDVTRYALAMIAVGFAMNFGAKREKLRQYGSMILGLGLLFYGMGVMGEAMVPLRDFPPFLDLMVRMENPLLEILVGALFTGLVQSSAATTGIAIVMASGGLMTLPAGIALALGANIGTCVTAVLAAIGKPREAQRAATVHVLFNVLGVLLWLPFIDQLAALTTSLSPSHPALTGTARMAEEVPRQIANAHTVFNVANTLLFLPFTGLLARLVERLLPDLPEVVDEIVEPRFLDDELLETPSLALANVRLELGHLGSIVLTMLDRFLLCIEEEDRAGLNEISQLDDQLDSLHRRILGYMGRIRIQPLTKAESREFLALLSAGDELESIGDVVEQDLVASVEKAAERGIEPSETTREMLTGLYRTVQEAVELTVLGIGSGDRSAAGKARAMKREVNRQIEDLLHRQAERLSSDDDRPLIFRAEMEMVDALKRIYTLARRASRKAFPPKHEEQA